MELVNETGLVVGWTVGFQPDGRERVIVAIKGTFSLPDDAGEPVLCAEQPPLTESDVFTGEPGYSATLYESDYAHHKPYCDVLLNGSAYAPEDRPAEKVTVGLHLGRIQKRFEVVGDRIWDQMFVGFGPSRPTRFARLPISYDRAYGGTDKLDGETPVTKTYLDNPVGVGYYPLSGSRSLVGRALANTQELGHSAEAIDATFQPMSFGPLGRNFRSRIRFAGTYGQKWLDEKAPFFPDDFDSRYFQCAPADQQMDYPKGGETVVLENLTPAGMTVFQLPTKELPVLFARHRGNPTQVDAVIDTILLEPDQQRFSLTWRACLALRRNCFEIREVVAGRSMRSHFRAARWATKKHYKNLDEFIRSKAGGQSL